MHQLKGYETPGKEQHICLLQCVLYGLKQARWEWYHLFCEVMHKLKLTRCQAKNTVFHRYTDKHVLIITVDVDNLTMAGNNQQTILQFKDQLHEVFKIKELGDLHWLLGIEVKRDCMKQMITFLKWSYIDKIMERFSLQDVKPLTIPLDTHHLLTLCNA